LISKELAAYPIAGNIFGSDNLGAPMQSVLITGGAGFIGQNLVHAWRAARPDDWLVVVDAMTYAANVRSLEPLIADRSILFVKGDIGDAALMRRLFEEHKFTRVAHLAAESHVDRSIADPEAFLQTNVLGTFTLLKAALDAWRASGTIDRARFLHVSTDEVYGSLDFTDPAFTESSPYRPNSPYAASKAASDHLVRAYVTTYGMPALITNCSNNYGPYQHPEKLIPLMIIHALEGKPLPIYGDGSNVRDWLHVSDHCDALMSVIERGRVGETYNVGGGNEENNRDVVGLICDTLDRTFAADAGLASRFPSCPAATGASCRSLVSYVTDRPGHDHRYAIDATKLARELGKQCSVRFEPGLERTVRWYLDQENWWRDVTSGAYKAWIDKNYGFRIAV
jgi:dTDP-glucose 4,6-dehydratase